MHCKYLWGVVLVLLGFLLFPVHWELLGVLFCVNLALSLSVFFKVSSTNYLERTERSSFIFLGSSLLLGMNLAPQRWILNSGWVLPLIFFSSFSTGALSSATAVPLLIFLISLIVIFKGLKRIGEVRTQFVLEALSSKQLSLAVDFIAERTTYQKASERLDATFEEHASMERETRFIKGNAITGIVLPEIEVRIVTVRSVAYRRNQIFRVSLDSSWMVPVLRELIPDFLGGRNILTLLKQAEVLGITTLNFHLERIINNLYSVARTTIVDQVLKQC